MNLKKALEEARKNLAEVKAAVEKGEKTADDLNEAISAVEVAQKNLEAAEKAEKMMKSLGTLDVPEEKEDKEDEEEKPNEGEGTVTDQDQTTENESGVIIGADPNEDGDTSIIDFSDLLEAAGKQ